MEAFDGEVGVGLVMHLNAFNGDYMYY
jgi:hypothetical protein